MNKNEEERFIPFEVVIKFQKTLLEQYISNPIFKKNQDLLLISLYRWLPERDELKTLKFTTIYKTDDDYIYLNNDIIYLILNNEKQKHNELHINLSQDFKELADIIKDSYIKYKCSYVFTDYNNQNKPISIHGLHKRMINLYSFTGKRVGVNILRSSYVTYQAEQKRLRVKDKKKLAKLMRTRRDKNEDHYIKILPQNEKQEIIKQIPEPILKPSLSPIKNS